MSTKFVNPSQPDMIDRNIYLIRGMRVMLDSDLAQLYGVSTKRLNEQVKRNLHRFPGDFMFRLTLEEAEFTRPQNMTSNRPQIATGSQKHRDPRFLPYAFTEHGAVMLASVLNSEVAVRASVEIVRAFVRLRSILAAHKELARKLDEIEKKYDNQFVEVFIAIRKLMRGPEEPKKQIGFRVEEARKKYQAKKEDKDLKSKILDWKQRQDSLNFRKKMLKLKKLYKKT